MENKPKNVIDKLDSIEASQSATQAQNEQILALLKKLNSQFMNQNVGVKPQPQVSNHELLRDFIKNSKKEYVWFGPINKFNKSKAIVNTLFVDLIIVGVL